MVYASVLFAGMWRIVSLTEVKRSMKIGKSLKFLLMCLVGSVAFLAATQRAQAQ